MFSSVTSIINLSFNGCSKLKEIDCRHIISLNYSSNTFGNCTNLYKIILSSCKTIGFVGNVNNQRAIFYNCNNLTRLVMPTLEKFYAIGQYNGTETKLSMVDIGNKLSNIEGGNKRLSSTTSTVVIRAKSPTSSINSFLFRRLYVPSDAVEVYKNDSVWSSFASKTYAIGGAEWIAEFGSADEYANLTEQEYADTYGWLAEQEQS